MSAPADLLARHRAGDAMAGPALCRAYLPAVRSLALAGTMDPATAAEVARATLIRVRGRLAEARDPGRLLQIITEAVREELKNSLRSTGGRRAHLVELSAEAAARPRGPLVHLPEIFGDLEPEKAAWMLLEAVSWIPVQSQALFLLRYLEGLGYAEIADLLGKSEHEVGPLLAAARSLYEREFGLHLRKLAEP